MIQMARLPIPTASAFSPFIRSLFLAGVLLLVAGLPLAGSIASIPAPSSSPTSTIRGALPRRVSALAEAQPAAPAAFAPRAFPVMPVIPSQGTGTKPAERPADNSSISQSNPPARDPQDWQSWPVVPQLSERMLAVYAQGLALGNNPHAFTKVGDGEISALWFLTDFDLGAQYYDLGPYVELQSPIAYFAGSFSHVSQAARRGFNTTRILDPRLANPQFCAPGESPLECELHRYQPSFALVSLGTNQVWASEVLEPELRQIIEILIAHGVVPVFSTKADNLEGDHRINTIVAQLAVEYDAPLWNFWRAVQGLPEHGMQADLEHLTYAPNDFADPLIMEHAWPMRNLTALQVLDALRLAVR